MSRPKRRKRAYRPALPVLIYERHNPRPLMANGGRSIKGPNGKPTCRWCGVEVEPPRRSWCSDACVHEFKVRSHAGYARAQVYKRDRGVCRSCGLDASKLRGRLKRMPHQCRKTYAEILGLGRTGYIRSLWHVDHIVPVVEGGGSCGLRNLRTLCVWCHKRETRKLRARLSRRCPTKPVVSSPDNSSTSPRRRTSRSRSEGTRR